MDLGTIVFISLACLLIGYFVGILHFNSISSEVNEDEEERRKNRAKDLQYFENLIIKSEFEKKSGEPLPPWLIFLDVSPFDIPWNMGAGESYLTLYFSSFWAALSEKQREEYFARFDLGQNWSARNEWYEWFINIGDDET